MRVELIRSDMEPLVLIVQTSAPCSDAGHLWTLLAPRLERAHLGCGVEGVRLTVLWSKRQGVRQSACWPGEVERTAEVSRLLDTLHERLGTECVVRPVDLQSHIPERAFTVLPVVGPVAGRAGARSGGRTGARKAKSAPSLASVVCDRPTLLLERPVPIHVTLLVPDGPLASVNVRGDVGRVQRCIGPERIAGEWWQAGSTCRDYFKVQTEDGRWLWIYRNMVENERWFLHGEWA